jgi:AraC family transcriptional regulator
MISPVLPTPPAYWRLRRATAYIESNLAHNISVATAAHLSGMSRAHFGRAFKASTGITVHHWILRARIIRAQELLATGRAPIATISATLGFADQSHFTRVFKRLTGKTPGRWQRDRR